MSERVVPDVRAGLAVVLRALVAGAVLGGLVALVLGLIDTTPDTGLLPGLLVYGCGLGAAIAAVSAGGWLLTVGHGPRWLAELVAGLVAAAPFGLLWLASEATIAGVLVVAVGLVAALVARWQGYERDRNWTRVRPTSSPHAG